jgi:hypothetical protein
MVAEPKFFGLGFLSNPHDVDDLKFVCRADASAARASQPRS